LKTKIIISIIFSIVVLVAAIALGSVRISPGDVWGVIWHRAFGGALSEGITSGTVSIIWNLRLPRSLLAFIVGGALAVSGAVMQGVLRNPLASSFTLGVSSGASLGAGIIILYGITIPIISVMTLPLVGFIFGMGTLVFVIAFTSRLDRQMQNNTIILTGMVFSLFVNGLTMLLSALAREQLQRLIFWQMGSFSMRDWLPVYILTPIILIGIIVILRYNRELDIMTFGDEQAVSLGVNIKRVKWILLMTAAALTGSAISFVGVIGFIDLVAPHVVRKIFGASHRLVIPMSAIFGGAFMVICDLVARTIADQELPVGAITAMIGAPFFAYIFFLGRKKSSSAATGGH
jgi:iron complex transport system permease protein